MGFLSFEVILGIPHFWGGHSIIGAQKNLGEILSPWGLQFPKGGFNFSLMVSLGLLFFWAPNFPFFFWAPKEFSQGGFGFSFFPGTGGPLRISPGG